MRHRRLWPSLVTLIVLAAFGVAACEPTGSERCDELKHAFGARAVAEAQGYRVDCTPGFEGRAPDGRLVVGWTEHKSRTVWIWPNRIKVTHDDAGLLRVLWHEAGHTIGLDEHGAEVYAWCHMTAAEVDGIGFESPYPTEAECSKHGW